MVLVAGGTEQCSAIKHIIMFQVNEQKKNINAMAMAGIRDVMYIK